jgi:hypothetical protein
MSEVYRIGIAILLADNTAAGLTRISHRLLGIHATTGQINANFGKWATLLGGAAGVMAGVGILKGMRGIAEHGKELLDQQDKLIRAGRTHTEVANLTAEAYAKITKEVPTAKASDVLRMANELTLVKGSFGDAAHAAAMSLKLEALVGNATGRKSEGEGYNVWRALELKNVTLDHAATDKLMGGMVQAMIASGGKVTGLDWLTTARQGGVAWTNLADKFLTGTLPTVIQELGGMRTGTSLMTSYQTLLGATTLRKQQYEMFSKLGVIDESKVTHDKGGRVNVGVGAIKGSTLGMQDPYTWTQEILKPALEAAGYKTIQQQREVMAKLFPNRNANRMFDIFLDPASVARIEKDRNLYSQAAPLNKAYESFVTKNPKGVEAAFHAQYESMMQAIGGPLMQSAMPVMRMITDMFNRIGEFANAHPVAVQYIGQGFAALGIALTAAGGAAILAALGPVGWIVGGIVALGATLTAIPWGYVFKDFVDAFAMLNNKLKPLLDDMIGWLTPYIDRFNKWVSSKVTPPGAGSIPLGVPGFEGLQIGPNADHAPPDTSRGGPLGIPGFEGVEIPPERGAGKQSWNAIPPGRGTQVQVAMATVNLDGRRVGEATLKYIVDEGQGPSQGSAYFDGTFGASPVDLAMA